MDIHPPSGALRSIREYLVHLSMVVLGILIALGLEQWRDARHDRELAQRAIEDMRSEIRENRVEVVRALSSIQKVQVDLAALLDLQNRAIEARRLRKAPPADPGTRSWEFRFPALSSAAWDAALAMQAFGRIDFNTARKLAQVYTSQRSLGAFQESMRARVFGFVSRLSRPWNGTPDAMEEQAGALKEALAWTTSLMVGYQRIIEVYERLEPAAGGVTGELHPSVRSAGGS